MARTATESGMYVTIYVGHTLVSDETLNATPDDHVFTMDHAPVSTQNLRLIGTKGAVSRPLVNFTLEPLTGTITIPDSFPAFDSITASYYYYTDYELDILTKDYKVEHTTSNYELAIDGSVVPTIPLKKVATRVSFKAVLSGENQRQLLTETVERQYYVILIDKNVDEDYGLRAFEGPVVSSEQASFQKGLSYLLPVAIEPVCMYGSYDEDDDEIAWR